MDHGATQYPAPKAQSVRRSVSNLDPALDPAREVYVSTRADDHRINGRLNREEESTNPQHKASLRDVLFGGMAADGGLYVPKIWHEGGMNLLPVDVLLHRHFGIDNPSRVGMVEVATILIHHFLQPFGAQWVSMADISAVQALVRRALSSFTHADVLPLRPFEATHDTYLLETFHGPTLSFKDVAMQILGQLFESAFVSEVLGDMRTATVFTATSGDTGAAALAALAGRKGLKVMVLHPHGGVSDVQRRQMTTITAPNVANVAVRGTFDDCQAIVKSVLVEQAEAVKAGKDVLPVVAVNSINWFRIVAQMAYYVMAAVRLGKPVDFYIPTGNVGNVLAAVYARRWLQYAPLGSVFGHPSTSIRALVACTNANTVVRDMLLGQAVQPRKATQTLAPAMDIVWPSNFERYIHLRAGQIGKNPGSFTHSYGVGVRDGKVPEDVVAPLVGDITRDAIAAISCSDQHILSTIAWVHDTYGHIVDPHTATAVHGWRSFLGINDRGAAVHEAGFNPATDQLRTMSADQTEDAPLFNVSAASSHAGVTPARVIVATAHPAKFPDTILRALRELPAVPEMIHQLENAEERCTIADIGEVRGLFAKFQSAP